MSYFIGAQWLEKSHLIGAQWLVKLFIAGTDMGGALSCRSSALEKLHRMGIW